MHIQLLEELDCIIVFSFFSLFNQPDMFLHLTPHQELLKEYIMIQQRFSFFSSTNLKYNASLVGLKHSPKFVTAKSFTSSSVKIFKSSGIFGACNIVFIIIKKFYPIKVIATTKTTCQILNDNEKL